MERKYLRLNCRLNRWGKTIQVTFLIDVTSPAYPTVVYERETYKSLLGRKVIKPRPLRATAYSFAHLESAKGDTISDKITHTGAEASEFVARVLNLAVPISEEEYRRELQKVIWPNLSEQPEHVNTERDGKEGKESAKKSEEDVGEKTAEAQKEDLEKRVRENPENGRVTEENEVVIEADSVPEDIKRKLALDLIDSAERMNNEALKLLKSARMLLQ